MLRFFNHVSVKKKKKKNVCETFVVIGVESSPLTDLFNGEIFGQVTVHNDYFTFVKVQ